MYRCIYLFIYLLVSLHIYTYTNIYIYIYIHIYINIYIYILGQRASERERERERESQQGMGTYPRRDGGDQMKRRSRDTTFGIPQGCQDPILHQRLPVCMYMHVVYVYVYIYIHTQRGSGASTTTVKGFMPLVQQGTSTKCPNEQGLRLLATGLLREPAPAPPRRFRRSLAGLAQASIEEQHTRLLKGCHVGVP